VVGRSHQLVLGKHSGSQGVMHAYKQLGIHIDRTQAGRLLPLIRHFVSFNKRAPQSAELNQFLHTL
jgi:homocitrate synthase NifV